MQKDNYFLGANGFLLLSVLIGFAPSFYLRPFNYPEGLPIYLIVHGVSSTAWFLVILLQAYWVSKGQLISHRRFGYYFMLLAPLLILSAFFVLGDVVRDYHEQFPPLAPGEEVAKERMFKALIIIGDILQLTTFLVFIFLGYQYRNHPASHKRAMLIASILISQQAFVRIGKFEWFMIGDNPGASGGIYATLAPLLLLLSLLVYDLIQLKKVNRMSFLGIFAYIAYVAFALALNAFGLPVAGLEYLR